MSQDYNYGRGVSSSTSRQVSRRDELRVTGELPTVDHSPSRSYHQQGSYSTPGSARGSPVVRRSTRGGARSSSPLGYAGETSASQHAPVPHSMSTGSFAPGYYDDLGSPAMDHLDRRGAGGGSVGGPAGSSGGHHRSRSATRSTGISRYGTDPHDREFMPIREPRERSLDRGMDMSHHRRERSLERGYFEDDLYGPPRDPHAMTRSTRHSPNPDLTMKHSTGTSRDSYFVELQHQNSEFQKELGQLKKELELTNQKLGSSMHSIKTFWSPELKKERALRKEESAKYSLINDQLKLLNSENQKQAMLVRQLEEELRLRSMRNPSAELQNQMEALYAENDHLTREITILRETIKELELRIDTQKQTLQARDESIKKLLEMLQSKGVGKEQERHMFQHMQALAQKQIEELRTEVTRRDQELLAMSAKMKTLEEQHADYQRHIAVLKESLCAKEEHYNMLQADVEELRQRLEEKNRLIEKKTQTAVQATQERNRLNNELNELRDHMDIKDRKINVLQRKMDLLDANHKLASIGNGGEELTHLRKQVEEQRRQLEEQRRQLEEQRHQLEDYRKQMESQRQQLSKGTPADPAQKKMIDDKAKALEKMEIEMKKRKERLDHMEEQLKQKMVNAVPGKGPPASVQAAELQKALAEKEQLLASHQKDLDRMKEEGKRSQNELERLLQLMQMTQEEQNTKDKQIQDLQHALRAEKTKVQKLQTAGAQMADQEVSSKQKLQEDIIKKYEENVQELEEKLKLLEYPDDVNQQMKVVVKQKNERIEELEEALKESVGMTMETEHAVVEMEEKWKQAVEQGAKLDQRLQSLQSAHLLRCTPCRTAVARFKDAEGRLQKLLSERQTNLEELFDLKHEALTAAISEKDAHLAMLEVSGIRTARQSEEADKLKTDKRRLMDRIKEENEKRVLMIQECRLPSEASFLDVTPPGSIPPLLDQTLEEDRELLGANGQQELVNISDLEGTDL